MPKSNTQCYALKAWFGGTVALRTIPNRKYRIRQTMPGPNGRSDGEIIGLLTKEESESASGYVSMLKHIDDVTEAIALGEFSFDEAHNEVLTAVFRMGIRIGAAQKEKELKKKRKNS